MSDNVEHIIHENGINEFILHSDDRGVVDEYISYLEELVVKAIENDGNDKIHVLINLTQTQNIPPFTYITKQERNLLHKYHDDRDKIHIRSAALARHDEMTIISLFEAFLKLLPVDAKVKSFESNQREQAIEWLLEE